MKFIKPALLILSSMFLASCAAHHYALNPPPGNTTWSPDAVSAIVLLGFVSDEPVNSIMIADDIEPVSIASLLFPDNLQNVLAMHFRSGEKFQLLGFNYSKTTAYASRYMAFENLPVIEIEQPGIYFYGNFYSKGGKGGFSEKFDANVVAIAEKLYPKVFSVLEPMNF